MAPALINVPKKAKRGEIIEIKTLMSHIMETGYRTPRPATSFRATSSRALLAVTTEPKFSAPICFRQSPQIPSSRSSRLRPRAASSISNGSATTGLPRPPRPRLASNETCWHHRPGGAADRGVFRPCRRNPARRAPLRIHFHDAGNQSHAGRRHHQSRHAVGARRRSAVEGPRPARPARPAPTAMTTRAPA